MDSTTKLVGHDIVVVGASAGGVAPLSALARNLPHDFPAAVFIVLHVSPAHPSHLHEILTREGGMQAFMARDGDPITPGRIVVARPDRHLLLKPGHVIVATGPKENRCRPSIDALFRSAAVAYGSRVIGVVLSGLLDDGVAGLWAIKQRGGISIVQDPWDAQFPAMPRNALAQVAVDHCLPVSEIPALLQRLAKVPAPLMEPVSADPVNLGSESTRYLCPECDGPLTRLNGGGPGRFECPAGHLYSLFALMRAQTEKREDILWSAVRSLEDRAHLAEQELSSATTGSNGELAKAFTLEASEARRQAASIRDILHGSQSADAYTTAMPREIA